ncbi:unnamed protein product [Pseudo-nitzschia multistriata]|uniref:Uncharacterized protein n=1 Tax=Pseudo-nitzschia multistriata TaxID=183589 RepID=A0A448ZLQ2_9STRA|nr:unnamed protein product [Pseudo-nitzschia multistriata]
MGSLDLALVLEISYCQKHLVLNLRLFNWRPVHIPLVPLQKFSSLGLGFLNNLRGQFRPSFLNDVRRNLVFLFHEATESDVSWVAVEGSSCSKYYVIQSRALDEIQGHFSMVT